ncbi:MAG: hypothetical protein B6243_12985 [Anaerolineaceae bacterium 4572_5.2]|nr:MAG: hypothetical protein B6243_12985 [Anaerolineaceae bacterium 4572_5.2]
MLFIVGVKKRSLCVLRVTLGNFLLTALSQAQEFPGFCRGKLLMAGATGYRTGSDTECFSVLRPDSEQVPFYSPVVLALELNLCNDAELYDL